jgi:hypothetical protein
MMIFAGYKPYVILNHAKYLNGQLLMGRVKPWGKIKKGRPTMSRPFPKELKTACPPAHCYSIYWYF